VNFWIKVPNFIVTNILLLRCSLKLVPIFIVIFNHLVPHNIKLYIREKFQTLMSYDNGFPIEHDMLQVRAIIEITDKP